MEQKLQQFTKDYTGKLVDFDNAFGAQCVDLMNQFCQDVLGIPKPIQILPGQTAYQIFQNANSPLFAKILNTPTNFPSAGDLLFFKPTMGNGAGHVGIVVIADTNTVTIFEENDISQQNPTGAAQTKSYDYSQVVGWLHYTGTIAVVQPSASLNTYGLDPTNEQSNQVVFDTWHQVSEGMYIPIAQYNALKNSTETLQENFDTLSEKYNATFQELTQTNGTLETLKKSDYDYGQEAITATKLAKTYGGFMDDFAAKLDLPQNNQTDQELHDEIIKEIIELRANQKAPEGSQSVAQQTETILSLWETQFKDLINELIKRGLNNYLTENNMRVVDLAGNPQDDTIAEKVVSYLDDKFHRLEFLEKALIKTQQKIEKTVPFIVRLGNAIIKPFYHAT